METRDFLAGHHRRVVDEFIQAVLELVVSDMSELERNILGFALRSEVETRLVPGLLEVNTLLLGVGPDESTCLTECLDRVQHPIPSET